MTQTYSTDPSQPYDGPDFDEYCISEGKYLRASRDRTPCLTCALSDLCRPGFEEQVRRAAAGEEPSLTKHCLITQEELGPDRLLAGLDERQKAFVAAHIFNPNTEKQDVL